jgi:hypothetical protein
MGCNAGRGGLRSPRSPGSKYRAQLTSRRDRAPVRRQGHGFPSRAWIDQRHPAQGRGDEWRGLVGSSPAASGIAAKQAAIAVADRDLTTNPRTEVVVHFSKATGFIVHSGPVCGLYGRNVGLLPRESDAKRVFGVTNVSRHHLQADGWSCPPERLGANTSYDAAEATATCATNSSRDTMASTPENSLPIS